MTLQRGLERQSVVGAEIGDQRGKRGIGDMGPDLGVEVLERLGGHRGEPVAGLFRALAQGAVEHVPRRGVVQDVGAVLAAEEIDVVDPQIGRDLLVGGRPVGTLPLDEPGRTPPEAVVGSGEHGAVVVGGAKDPVVVAARECGIEAVVDGVVDVEDEPGPSGERSFDVAEAEQAEPGDDLGDLGAGVSHRGPPRTGG